MNKKMSLALLVTTAIFFIFGFITELNDVLIPHLKAVFDLNYTRAMLIQFCFFTAYLIMALPAGCIVSYFGYQQGMMLGLLISGAGALLILPAAQSASYPFFLGALFVVASGIVLLQCAGNPYVSLLGAPERAASRLNLAGAVNSAGHAIGPAIGGALILNATSLRVDQLALLSAAERAQTVQPLYFGLACALIVLALVTGLFPLPVQDHESDRTLSTSDTFSVLAKYRQLRFGVLAIFLYVGAEVSIGSFIANYAMRPDIGAATAAELSGFISIYWFSAMIGRFAGAALMIKLSPRYLLAGCASANVLLLLTTAMATGPFALWAVLAVGFFNSIMFPTIFSLAIQGLGADTKKASSLLIMAIFGGALIPLAQGKLVDTLWAYGGDETRALQLAFLLPALCYIYVAWYGRRGSLPVSVKSPTSYHKFGTQAQ